MRKTLECRYVYCNYDFTQKSILPDCITKIHGKYMVLAAPM